MPSLGAMVITFPPQAGSGVTKACVWRRSVSRRYSSVTKGGRRLGGHHVLQHVGVGDGAGRGRVTVSGQLTGSPSAECCCLTLSLPCESVSRADEGVTEQGSGAQLCTLPACKLAPRVIQLSTSSQSITVVRGQGRACQTNT